MSTMHNFHVPLPKETYLKLRKQAEENKSPATEIARKAIESWLKEQEKKSLDAAIEKYALANAGTKFDLDKEMEDAAVEFILQKGKK